MNDRRFGDHLSTLPSAGNPATDEHGLFALVLAAGGSRRLGRPKQLARIGSETLLRRAVRAATEVLRDRVIVVHGANADNCQVEIADFEVTNVVNAEWEKGISSSLQCGLVSLPPHCDSVLVMVCDQPLLNAAHLHRLILAWKPALEKIVVSAYSETIGVPVIWPRRLFPELMLLKGDRGAQAIIRDRTQDVVAVALPEAETDVDSPEDFDAVSRKFE